MQKESIMGTTPIPRLIIKTSIPLIISLLVNNLYNLVDSIFVSRVSEDALTGISIAAPLQMLMIALGCGLAVGLNAMVSKAMGEKQPEEVKKTTSAAIVMAFGAYLINVIVCLLLVKPYFAWQAGGNEVIARYGISYIRICMLFSFGQMLQWVFDRLLIATGKSNLFLATLGTASLVNVILDPILIFGYFGFPAMGTAGAAAATVTGQLAGGLLGIYLNIKRNKEIPVHFTLHIQKKYVANILKVGIPTDCTGNHVRHGNIYQYHPVPVFINSSGNLWNPDESSEPGTDWRPGNEQRPDPDYCLQLWGRKRKENP